MAKYRKRPVIVEAVQITDDTFDAPRPNAEHVIGVLYDPVARCAYVETLEGTMRADLGDWLITGIEGEVYPCRNSIFQATYEAVDDAHR